jgi:hypothetical protein
MFAQAPTAGMAQMKPSGLLSLRDLLSRVAHEIEVNSVLASDFHDVVSELAAENMTASVIERLQALDLISQTLAEIGIFLTTISAICPSDQTVPESVLDDIRLADLRDRLQGKAPDVTGSVDPELW